MSNVIEYLSDYEEEAFLRNDTFGKTDKHSTGHPGWDHYLGSGFGNRHGYEIITLFGETGVGKSMVALNMIAHEMVTGTKVGLMILEDDMPDVYNRILSIVGKDGMAQIKRHKNVDVLPQSMLERAWTFSDILEWLETKVEKRQVSLFLIDHINFLFDNASLDDPRREMAEQRKFMRDLNHMARRLRITIILVSHVAKGDAQGMAKVYGTTAITQVSTKVIGVTAEENQLMAITMYKSRFTRRQDHPHHMKRTGLKLEEYDGTVQPLPIPSGNRRNRKKDEADGG